ncbi:hypothetical protein N0V93_000590 [Gnomoniopsis smithogilvyi]|uniref:Glutathione S-transferase n=1 Tax=Gnomoniopsis smithogilvyi TaxID=1191159 RepID=A0A9W8Z000_9PEZI|nr:hypothetical protein N0V93_000590 [Gnomoniopsis smithogilvyi]
MAPFGTIYSYPGNFRVLRAQVIADLNGLELKNADFQMGVTNKSPEFLAKFPLGKVPAFEGADGFCLTEGAAISTYIAGSGPKASQLLGADMKTKARIAEWTLFTETEIVAHATPALVAMYKLIPYDEASQAVSAERFERALTKIEGTVKDGKKFLVGEELTLADLMVVSALYMAGGPIFDAEMRAKVPATLEYVKGISSIPQFAKVFGDFKPCEKRFKA